MAYVTPQTRNFAVILGVAETRKLIERFSVQAFPGSRPYTSYQGRITVSLSLGDGAYANLNFESREVRGAEITQDTPAGSTRIDVGGYVSGFNVKDDVAGKAEVQRFLDSVASSLQQTLEGFVASGRFRPRLMIEMPDISGTDLGDLGVA